jgi:diphthamide synthase subunit DPH2
MPAGRMGAQCAHAAAKLAKEFKDVDNKVTLILEVSHDAQLEFVRLVLKKHHIRFIEQRDDFPPYFDWQAVQAIITEPISKRHAKCLDLFKLWT